MYSRCDDCGRFMARDRRASWAEIYSHDGLDRCVWRCKSCTEQAGPVQSNARPYDGDMRPYQGFFAEEVANV